MLTVKIDRRYVPDTKEFPGHGVVYDDAKDEILVCLTDSAPDAIMTNLDEWLKVNRDLFEHSGPHISDVIMLLLRDWLLVNRLHGVCRFNTYTGRWVWFLGAGMVDPYMKRQKSDLGLPNGDKQ